jgi:hypothetical protein
VVAVKIGNMKTTDIDVDKVFNTFEWAGINLMWGAWTWAMMSESITWILGVIGGLTLIWFNVERALKARKERAMLGQDSKKIYKHGTKKEEQ